MSSDVLVMKVESDRPLSTTVTSGLPGSVLPGCVGWKVQMWVELSPPYSLKSTVTKWQERVKMKGRLQDECVMMSSFFICSSITLVWIQSGESSFSRRLRGASVIE